jgi:D-3-phosphoglycerate dehydrogenase / 2-oxoglutarate reductase
MKPKVLVTDLVDDVLINGLVDLGYDVHYNKDITQAQVDACINDVTGIVITTKISLTAQTLEHANRLKWIARAGSGLDHVDVNAAAARGIVFFTSPEGNAGSVGEHCVMLLLAMLRRLPEANNDTKQYRWDTDQFRVTELDGFTVGLLGYGHTGPAFAKRLQGFNVNVIAYDKYKLHFDDGFAKRMELEELFRQSDVFSIHLPLTAETRNMVNEAFFKQFSKPLYIINTSRGNILPVPVLLNGLVGGTVRYAAVDVLDNEAFETHSDQEKETYKQLISQRRLLITPHVAGKSSATRRNHANVLLAKIRGWRGL